jgi:hypothetical protein
MTPPSKTHKERSTSAVKSTWPGVYDNIDSNVFQKVVVAAETIVMPRYLSGASSHLGVAFIDVADLIRAAGV